MHENQGVLPQKWPSLIMLNHNLSMEKDKMAMEKGLLKNRSRRCIGTNSFDHTGD